MIKMNTTEIYERLTGVFQDVFVDESLKLFPDTRRDEVEEWDGIAHKILINRINRMFHTTIEESLEITRISDLVELISRQLASEKKEINSEMLLGILREVNPELKADVDMIESGLIDSMMVMAIIAKLEDTLMIEIDFDDIIVDNFRTIDTIVEMVKKKVGV